MLIFSLKTYFYKFYDYTKINDFGGILKMSLEKFLGGLAIGGAFVVGILGFGYDDIAIISEHNGRKIIFEYRFLEPDQTLVEEIPLTERFITFNKYLNGIQDKYDRDIERARILKLKEVARNHEFMEW